jgi:hypothetical protein
MYKEKLAVNVISYIDDNKAKNLIGVANNIFRYVKESKIDGDFVHIIQQYPEGFTKQVFIPVNNVGLIEAFNSEEFHEAYPIKAYK